MIRPITPPNSSHMHFCKRYWPRHRIWKLNGQILSAQSCYANTVLWNLCVGSIHITLSKSSLCQTLRSALGYLVGAYYLITSPNRPIPLPFNCHVTGIYWTLWICLSIRNRDFWPREGFMWSVSWKQGLWLVCLCNSCSKASNLLYKIGN